MVVCQDFDDGRNNPRIRARRYNANGGDLGYFFVEPTYGAVNNQHEPAVSMVDDGRFVVVWNGSSEIYGRLFNADGSASTATFRVNQTTSGTQQVPSVAVYPDGQFVVTWRGEGSGESEGIEARR